MCGICGEFAFAGGVRREDVDAMSTALRHRGPDDSDRYVNGPIGFGHRRLAIIDLSERGRQPMWDASRTLCLIFNGELYNYREIAKELEGLGHRFRSASDTEIVVTSVRQWGVENAVKRFVGMFAFALWDEPAQRLTLVRDRAGIKPLFYWQDANRVLFGSELRALMAHPAFRADIDPVGLGQFFVTGYTLGETTPLAGVRRVPAGSFVTIERDALMRVTQYWSLDDTRRARRGASPGEVDEALLPLLESAVGYRLVSDVPVVNFLSGGTDSSLVAAILSKRLNADVLNITVGFDEAAFDEVPKATQVARELGIRHQVHVVRADEARQALQEFAEIFDEPFGDTSGIPTWLLSRVAVKEAKVALSADGGDEQFCGYSSYARYDRAWRLMQRVPGALRRAGASVLGALPLAGLARGASREGSLLPQTAARLEKSLRIAGVRSAAELIRVMNEKAWTWDRVPAIRGSRPANLFEGTVLTDAALARAGDDFLGTMMRADYQSFLRDDILTKVDRASMHVSLEARDPLLDHRIAEFAFALPTASHFAGEHKRALKRLLRRYVSESVVSSPKRGFSIPLYAWMRGAWKPIVMDTLSFDSVRRTGLLDPAEVQAEVSRFYAHPGGSAERVWMLLSLQLWAIRWLRR